MRQFGVVQIDNLSAILGNQLFYPRKTVEGGDQTWMNNLLR